MLFPKNCLVLTLITVPALAWAPSSMSTRKRGGTVLFGYLDDISKYTKAEERETEEFDRSKTDMAEEDKDRYGVGDWSNFVDFEEFDGGDGQMGVAGDGSKGLEKEWKNQAHMTSRARSARNAWGSSSGYADELVEKGMEATRAQQLENWQNQQELRNARNSHKAITDAFDAVESTGEEDWRTLSKFGVERNQEFDLDETFGEVTVGNTVYHHIELNSRVNRAEVFEFNLLVRD